MSLELYPATWTTVELLVDSGSNTSGIDASVASANGVPLGRLPWGDLSVVGGTTTQPYLDAIRAALGGDAGSGVRLRPLWVLAGSEKPIGEGADSGILGLDALASYRASVVLDLNQGTGWIEW